jgi:hypothetical protein
LKTNQLRALARKKNRNKNSSHKSCNVTKQVIWWKDRERLLNNPSSQLFEASGFGSDVEKYFRNPYDVNRDHVKLITQFISYLKEALWGFVKVLSQFHMTKISPLGRMKRRGWIKEWKEFPIEYL